MKKRVYIHCEITKREFEGKLLLSTIAADKNFDVYMGNIQGLESNINIPTGLLHFTSCTPSKKILSLFKRLKKKNFIISCQDEEGGVEEVKNFFSKLPVGMFNYRFSESSLKLIDALFSWSNFDYNHLISRFPKYKKKIFNTGNPRADMWSKVLKKVYNEPKKKDFILISSHTDGPSSNKTLIENLKIIYEAYFVNKDKEFEKNKIHFFDNYSAKTKYLYIFVDSIINLANKFKNEKFIFRPHPVENLELWKFLFRNNSNIFVTKENSSTFWMHRSKILLHNGCYTSVEAANLGVDIVTYIPKEIKKYVKPFTGGLGFRCFNQNQLFKNFQKILSKKNKKIIDDKKLQNFNKVNSRFHFPSKVLNSEKIVDTWVNLNKCNNTNYIDVFLFKFLILIKKLQFIFFKKYKDINISDLDRKFENINFHKSNLMVQKIITILKLNSNIKFELINNHICRIVKSGKNV